ncbi:MAG: intein-containing DNA gyrase subunit B [Candidatus Pacebacteria bacterium]|nr:intein-containing DNA gyrase subunit B [Candidatus Paceibacterota bacterium]MCF7862949.1 intein-containing DNA gyrase subunit B [Candidatus Paceibacterota bacterium]
MYIGTTGPEGLHHLIWEIFDNSRDEAMGGFCDTIEVVILPGNRIRVTDNGRGIPIDVHKKTKVSALETVMTTLHAGGKFGGEGYKVSGGLHGVGASVVNALSIYCRAEVHKDGGIYVQEYSKGVKKSAVKKIGSTKQNGTIITFEPDIEIFKEIKFDWNVIVSHIRQQAYLVKGLRVSIIDAREFDPTLLFESKNSKLDPDSVFYFKELGLELPSVSFYFEGGLTSLIRYYNKFQKPVQQNIFYVEKEQDGVGVEIALQYVDDIVDRIVPFANNIYNPEGGTHVTGFKTALTRTLNTYCKKNEMIKESEGGFTGEDVLEGLTVVISVKLREIQFEGQTKAKLGSVEAQGAVATVFGEAFSGFLEENPDEAKSIIGKAVLAMKARKAAKAAKDSVLRKGALEGMTLPGKLADCQTKDASESELFIVEGDSAGGCFSGDTKVALVDGRNISFKEIIAEYQNNKKNYCYTILHDGSIGIQEIKNPRRTKTNAEVIKIILDNNEEIVCTPDHLFMLRDGTYKQAKDILITDSLMPLRKKISEIGGRITIKGYEMVYNNNSNRWIFTHMLADEFNLRKGFDTIENGAYRHHKDFNKTNNNPDNIVRLTKEEHISLHSFYYEKNLKRPDVLEKLSILRKTPEYRQKIREKMLAMREDLSIRAKAQWENEEYKKYMVNKFLDFYASNKDYREKSQNILQKAQKEYWASTENKKKQSKKVKEFFAMNPLAKVNLSEKAKKQWMQGDLLDWRSKKTQEQWTEEFREKRRIAYNKTYYENTIRVLKRVYDQTKSIDIQSFEDLRKIENNKNVLSFNTFFNRFFDEDFNRLKDAVENYNHKIKSIVHLSGKIDVYDIEVPGTHNFALASGVFVHNSAKQGRDRRTQAILPLRGKILNVERARIDKMLASKEVKALVIALGTSIGDTFDIEKARYHKIIIATDADVDGSHIRTLLLTLFYRYFKQIIEAGYIYIAQPPLFKIKKGKEVFYVYSDEEKNKIIGKEENLDDIQNENDSYNQEENTENTEDAEENTEEVKKKSAKPRVQRYKGLGEMNPEELWETTMDPERRVIKQVTIEDAEEANKIFDILMGSDVVPRKSFIQSNAKLAEIDL